MHTQTQTHAAGVPRMAAEDPRQTEIDQVLDVLRKTQDGDLLDPRDLKLSEHVVNYGRGALTDEARTRWDSVVEQVALGQYLKPWFHDVEHLTRDHRGYVRWKDAIIEHYSFQNREREKAAAIRLGECCRYLEANGRPVNGAEMFKAYAEARHGQGLQMGPGLNMRRWVVIWLTEAHRAKIEVVEVEAESERDSRVLVAAAVENRISDWGSTPRAVRHFKVVSTADFDSAVEQLQQSCQWAMHSLRWQEYSNGRNQAEMLEVLRRTIRREELPVEADLMGRFFSGEGESIDPVLDEPVRERGG